MNNKNPDVDNYGFVFTILIKTNPCPENRALPTLFEKRGERPSMMVRGEF